MINNLFLMTFVALVLGSLPLWITLYRRSRSDSPSFLPQERIVSPFGLADVSIMFVFWIFGQLASSVVAAFALGIEPGDMEQLVGDKRAWFIIIIAVGQLASTLAGMGFILARFKFLRSLTAEDPAVGRSYRHLGWEIFGFPKRGFLRSIGIGLMAFPMIIPGVLLIQWLLTLLVPYEHSTLEMLAEDKSGLTIFSTWLVAGLVAPICEEIFFRGVLQAWFQRLGEKGFFRSEETITGGWQATQLQPDHRPSPNLADSSTDKVHLNPYQSPQPVPSPSPATPGINLPRYTPNNRVQWMPIVASSALFALAHVGQGLAPIPLFVLGLALGYLYRQTGSVVPCIVLHMGLNLFTLFWFTLKLFTG